MSNRMIFESFCGILGAIATFLFGAADELFFALVAFVALDYITGIIAAIIKRNLSSRIGFDGIFRKIMIFVLVAIANIIDVQVLGNSNSVIRSAVVAFLLANEGLSILENVAGAGLPVPYKLREILIQLKKKNGGNENESE